MLFSEFVSTIVLLTCCTFKATSGEARQYEGRLARGLEGEEGPVRVSVVMEGGDVTISQRKGGEQGNIINDASSQTKLSKGTKRDKGDRGLPGLGVPGLPGLEGDRGPPGQTVNEPPRMEHLQLMTILTPQVHHLSSQNFLLKRRKGEKGDRGVPGFSALPGERGPIGPVGPPGQRPTKTEIIKLIGYPSGPALDLHKGYKGEPGRCGRPGKKGRRGEPGTAGPHGERGLPVAINFDPEDRKSKVGAMVLVPDGNREGVWVNTPIGWKRLIWA